jgi:hypothetical protein
VVADKQVVRTGVFTNTHIRQALPLNNYLHRNQPDYLADSMKRTRQGQLAMDLRIDETGVDRDKKGGRCWVKCS